MKLNLPQETAPYDSASETLAHCNEVNKVLTILNLELADRGRAHDESKLHHPEKEVFDRVTPKLKGLSYGSPEYKESLKEMGPALDHHYASNRHHPEHFKNGVKDMTLVDFVEMFADWCAATKRHDDGNIFKSLALQNKKLGLGDVLVSILENTAREFKLGQQDEPSE